MWSATKHHNFRIGPRNGKELRGLLWTPPTACQRDTSSSWDFRMPAAASPQSRSLTALMTSCGSLCFSAMQSIPRRSHREIADKRDCFPFQPVCPRTRGITTETRPPIYNQNFIVFFRGVETNKQAHCGLSIRTLLPSLMINSLSMHVFTNQIKIMGS